MNYERCLKFCVSEVKSFEDFVRMYREYPKPSKKLWTACVKEARDMYGAEAIEMHCMGRYEVRLIAQGVETVAYKTAALILEEVAERNGLPLEFIVLAAAAAADFHGKRANPFRLVTDVSGRQLLLDIPSSSRR